MGRAWRGYGEGMGRTWGGHEQDMYMRTGRVWARHEQDLGVRMGGGITEKRTTKIELWWETGEGAWAKKYPDFA